MEAEQKIGEKNFGSLANVCLEKHMFFQLSLFRSRWWFHLDFCLVIFCSENSTIHENSIKCPPTVAWICVFRHFHQRLASWLQIRLRLKPIMDPWEWHMYMDLVDFCGIPILSWDPIRFMWWYNYYVRCQSYFSVYVGTPRSCGVWVVRWDVFGSNQGTFRVGFSNDGTPHLEFCFHGLWVI